MSKLLLLTLNEREEKVIDKIIATISDYIQLEPVQITPASVLSFPGLEIRQSGRRVFQDGEEINLTRLEYSTLVFLASNPGIVLTRTQIFEAVWNMESDSCHSSVVNMICNLRKKIEPDSKPNKTYIYYVCSTYVFKPKDKCTRDVIKEEVLYEAVLKAIQVQISLVGDMAEVVKEINNTSTVCTQSKRLQQLLKDRNKELEKLTYYIRPRKQRDNNSI